MDKSYQNPGYSGSPRGWKNCKKIGDVGEALLIRALRRLGLQVLKQVEGEAPAFDVEISARVEIKTDNVATRTGNVAVELECDGNTSGLSISKADFWAFVVGDEGLMLRADALGKLVEGKERTPCFEGQKRTMCVMLPMEILRKHARRIPLRGGGA